MDLGLISKSYIVRRLNQDDVDGCFELMRKNTMFYKYHPPFVTKESILEDMAAVPSPKSHEDKYYIGFFEDEILVAVMDLLMDYPAEKIAYIGFFMTDVQCQNKGIGSKIIRELCTRLQLLGYEKVRLGVDIDNPQSYAFWIKNRFSVLYKDTYIIMELGL